jgi:hypothetical protein
MLKKKLEKKILNLKRLSSKTNSIQNNKDQIWYKNKINSNFKG